MTTSRENLSNISATPRRICGSTITTIGDTPFWSSSAAFVLVAWMRALISPTLSMRFLTPSRSTDFSIIICSEAVSNVKSRMTPSSLAYICVIIRASLVRTCSVMMSTFLVYSATSAIVSKIVSISLSGIFSCKRAFKTLCTSPTGATFNTSVTITGKSFLILSMRTCTS